ncbi:MAG: transcriptional regulator, TetR family [Modestobacter sp.]|nr:transcriptional regulator, TetR family [Modestobacter sp.]
MDRSRPWRERVEAPVLELRERLSAHPGAVPKLVGGPVNGPHALEITERLLQSLADAGLDPEADARGLPAVRPPARPGRRGHG